MTSRRLVLATGVFDLLHYGHLRFLEESKKVGGKGARLVVLVARDATVERTKGKKPVMSENERRTLVASLKPVDKAVLGYRRFNIRRVIDRLKPNIITVGYDQDDVRNAVEKVVKENGLKIRIVRMRRFGRTDLYSSSKIKGRVIQNWGRL